MVEKFAQQDRRNVVDFANYQRASRVSTVSSDGSRWCRHCGASLLDDESEDDCSSAGLLLQSPARMRPRRFSAE